MDQKVAHFTSFSEHLNETKIFRFKDQKYYPISNARNSPRKPDMKLYQSLISGSKFQGLHEKCNLII